MDPSNIIVYPNGKLLHVARAYFKTACDVNYQNWPWGDQNCTFIGGFIFASSSRFVFFFQIRDHPYNTLEQFWTFTD